MFGLKKRLRGNLIFVFNSIVFVLFFLSVCLKRIERSSPGQTSVFTWDELKLINEILYDNVYLASFGVIFTTGHPLVGSLRGSSLLHSRF